jgi:hypothetical protein
MNGAVRQARGRIVLPSEVSMRYGELLQADLVVDCAIEIVLFDPRLPV